MPELRKDPVTHEWVIIATERSRRPRDLARREERQPPAEPRPCPFCAGNEFLTPPEVFALREPGTEPDGSGWYVRVVPNLFAALDDRLPLETSGRGMFDLMTGTGKHEVFIEGPDHRRALDQVPPEQTVRVLSAYRQRYLSLRDDVRLQHILIFRNHGRAAGASLAHPHSQLIATPMVPTEVAQELDGLDRYRAFRDRCVYCDLVREEQAMRERMVFANNHFVAISPFAARFPFEVWILPRRHRACFAFLDDDELVGWAEVLRDALARLRVVLDDPPYNFTLHTAPTGEDRAQRYHWHMEILPRVTTAAGFEMGTGIYINVTSPEDAARIMREAVLPPPPSPPPPSPSSGEGKGGGTGP